jgi:hypothetical protein
MGKIASLTALSAAIALGTIPTLANAQTDPAGNAKKLVKDRENLAKLTPSEFQTTATIRDGDLDTVATIETAKGFVSKVSARPVIKADNFLRAAIDKTTGLTVYVLYQSIEFVGLPSGFRDYSRVTYQSAAGLKSAALTSISHDVEMCSGITGLCVYREDFTVALDEDALRWIATLPVGTFWRFKFTGKSDGSDWEDQLTPAEAAGLQAAVSAYKTGHQLQ